MATAESWLRVVIYKLPDDQESGLEFVKSSLGDFIRVLKRQPGYGGGYWGDSPEDGIIAAVTHWSSLHAIEDAAIVLKELQSRGTDVGFSVLDVQNIQLFAVPAISMWTEDDEDQKPPRGRAHFRRAR